MVDPKKTTAKVDPELMKRAKIVAEHRGEDLYRYMDNILRPAIDSDYTAYIAEESRSIADQKGRRK